MKVLNVVGRNTVSKERLSSKQMVNFRRINNSTHRNLQPLENYFFFGRLCEGKYYPLMPISYTTLKLCFFTLRTFSH